MWTTPLCLQGIHVAKDQLLLVLKLQLYRISNLVGIYRRKITHDVQLFVVDYKHSKHLRLLNVRGLHFKPRPMRNEALVIRTNTDIGTILQQTGLQLFGSSRTNYFTALQQNFSRYHVVVNSHLKCTSLLSGNTHN